MKWKIQWTGFIEYRQKKKCTMNLKTDQQKLMSLIIEENDHNLKDM